ncbi:DNA polymerase III subunit delta [Oceanobacillus piezotolerans]|uniref:DNA polymerase III subunit delta n=1 Tax=Oceanobacillus piezotolerans TaxID=2448030 RepID=A0A498DER6_9BACI|nr:DNA polymerase III subunit delta [Oceanobacillus piezotolerans]RLL48025.1 DNA polymerase III subunit delta [Oceanobacillus piezotolerans]
MSYIETLKKLKKNSISPIYFIYGTENFFIENIKKEMMKQVVNNNEDNISVYSLDEVPIQEVIQDVETYPFFGERKLVIANNPVFLKSKSEKLPFEHDLSALEFYLTNPVDYTVFVIIAPFEKLDERKKISKSLKKYTSMVNCEPIKEREIRAWIETIINGLHITLDKEVYDLLEAEFSTNLQLLEVELEKLALYAGEEGHITREIAENIIAHNINSSSLRLVDAVIENDLKRAISIFKDLQILKEDPIALIGLLAFQFRTILRVKLLKQKGYSQFQMQKQLNVHPYVIKIALGRERQFTIQKLQQIINQLANTDAIMKQGRMEKEIAFELLIYNIIYKAA